MYRLLVCIADTHAPALLALAGLICLGASFVSVVLLQRSRTAPRHRLFWFGAAGFTGGVGIWSTHFVAMLAYDPGIAVSYEVGWTVGSLVIAITVATLALGIARAGHSRAMSMAAGTVFGLAIAGTHNLGMLGVVIPGHFVWNASAVLISDALGCLFAAAAFEALRRDPARYGRVASVALLVIAIFVLHFIGIGTLVAVPDPTTVAVAWVVPREMLAALIGALMLVVLIVGAAALWLDERMSAAASEVERLSQLAEAALEGIVVLRGEIIVDVNASLTKMLGRPRESIVGSRCADLLFDGEAGEAEQGPREGRSEGRLRRADGQALSVEMHLQTMAFPDGPRQILAVRDLSERSAAEAHIRFLAHHDALTGLLNRSSLLDRLEAEAKAADAKGRSFAIYYLDLDRFKEVNDTFGHPVGDALLKLVSDRLRGLLGSADAVFRMGGDEFVVVQSDLTAPGGIAVLAERIIAALTSPFVVAGRDLAVGVSIGVARYPEDGRDTVELLKFADIALYKAKGDGRRRVALFDVSLDAAQQERRQVEVELRHAIERDELSLVYQPQVGLSTGEVIAYEALLRWHSHRLGSIPPSRFIPVAEEAGLIGAIGAWALRAACDEAATWTRPCAIAVNLSPLQLQDPGLPALVQEALDRSGLDPRRLEVEITETALIRDRDRAAASIDRLKALGVRIALDDFGTGYSSLSYLQTFPFDTLKIDRCFVERLVGDGPSAAIVDSVVRLGHGLGLKVVAEGVETPAQLAALRAYGCDAVQGYLLGRPARMRSMLREAA